MITNFKRLGYLAGLLIAGAYLLIALRGPQGLAALRQTVREIRQLQESNANLARDNERKREEIRKLRSSKEAQERAIRQKLFLQRPTDTTFMLPDRKPPAAPPASSKTGEIPPR